MKELISLQKNKSSSESNELNILILGETGVGKSTWINAFANYLSYTSFEEAEASNLIAPIPLCFNLTDKNFDTITIKTGKDENEDFASGQSSTQGARIYEFEANGTTIRLIDTPGVGDVRGIEQDQLNMKNILDTIGQFKSLHGICLLLKSNNDKLTTQFRFCVKELLANLHKGASENITFCFTYSRGFHFRPADALCALNALLAQIDDVNIKLTKETMYSFDSEAVRYLAATKNSPPYEYSERDREDFRRSWNHSSNEMKRMLEHFQCLNPHPVKDTISLHNARNVVLKLTKPIAEVTRKIENNKLKVEEERHLIENSAESMQELSSHVTVSRSKVASTALDFPKLACYHMDCRKKDGTVSKIKYSICNDRYVVKGVRADTIGRNGKNAHEWQNWPGFTSDGVCIVCNHKFVHHSNLFYDSIIVDRVLEDEDVKNVLSKNTTAKTAKQEMVSAKSNLLVEFEGELQMICNASVRFAHFTRMNSITPYNDGMLDYLKLSIEEEKHHFGEESSNYKVLVKRLELYLRDKEILKEEMNKDNGMTHTFTPEDIVETVENLKSLKHSGKDLTEALCCIIETEKEVNKSVTIQLDADYQPLLTTIDLLDEVIEDAEKSDAAHIEKEKTNERINKTTSRVRRIASIYENFA